MSKHDLSELYQLQGLSLNEKIERTQARIRQWVEHYGIDHVYVSFSGGKDSTVLLDIARKMYPDVKAVYVDTSLEFPEIRKFVSSFPNVDILKPKMNFRQVIEKYGYPMISKEVSETVYGARKYLTGLAKKQSLDRQTDRQTDNYSYRLDKLLGEGKYRKFSQSPTDSAIPVSGGISQSTNLNLISYADMESMLCRSRGVRQKVQKSQRTWRVLFTTSMRERQCY